MQISGMIYRSILRNSRLDAKGSMTSVTGMRESAHLQGNQFNWVSSIFFFGQLAFAFPTMRVMQEFPLAKYVAVNVMPLRRQEACGRPSGRQMICMRPCRPGAAEASIVPAWVVFTSQWYRKDEQAFRVGLWFSMCGFAQMFGGYVAYGVATHIGGDPSASLRCIAFSSEDKKPAVRGESGRRKKKRIPVTTVSRPRTSLRKPRFTKP
jgi:MFS family permease